MKPHMQAFSTFTSITFLHSISDVPKYAGDIKKVVA